MKKGETRAAYQERQREEMRNRALRRLEADEKFLTQQLANVRRRIAEQSVPNATGDA